LGSWDEWSQLGWTRAVVEAVGRQLVGVNAHLLGFPWELLDGSVIILVALDV
jgi:hypothetical protein